MKHALMWTHGFRSIICTMEFKREPNNNERTRKKTS